jgi:hypothetical protein
MARISVNLKANFIAGATFIGMLMVANMSYAAEEFNEKQLSVAYLYNFMKFVEWPGIAAKSELILCITDNVRFVDELNAVSGQPVQGKIVRVKHIQFGETPRECQLLFLPREETPNRISKWLNSTGDSPTLTVSDLNEFLDLGGMIALVRDGAHLKFEVNLERTKRAGLKLSAQLLKVASEVKKG